jgi:chromosomal replication initiation ATPase DnaA|tara:strand:+ start:87 stop:788 length:702 start_codon:yes stop_codon:yes gene_type:complete
MEIWYEEVGFNNNPFSIKPAAYHNELYGYDVVSMISQVNDGKVLFIEGEYGKGKTTILKKIIKEFGGKNKLIYYSCNRTEDNLDIQKLVDERPGFFSRIFGNAPNDMILLLDEVQDLLAEDSDQIVKSYKKFFKSIVLVSSDYKEIKFSNGLKEIIGDNVIRLEELSDEDSIKIIRKRVGDRLLTDDQIKKIAKKSDNNPRKLLKNCEKVSRYSINLGYDAIKDEHIKKNLGE